MWPCANSEGYRSDIINIEKEPIITVCSDCSKHRHSSLFPLGDVMESWGTSAALDAYHGVSVQRGYEEAEAVKV